MSPHALVILCGVSFAGKSTLAAALAQTVPAAVVSLDDINTERWLNGGNGIPVGEWVTTHEIAKHRAGALLGARSVVVDDTTSLRLLRDQWRAVADLAGARSVLVWLVVDRAVQRQRLESNRRLMERNDVTDVVMAEHLASFEAPHDDERPVIVDGALPIELQIAIVESALVG